MIYSLGIPGIGVANAKVLAKYFEYNLEKIQNATAEELSQIEGVGEVMANAIVTYMQSDKNREQLESLCKDLEIEVPVVNAESQTLSGKNFVVTGSLNHFTNRDELKALIEEKGGKVTGSVTSKTECLINNDITSNSSKNKKAKELQVPILTEEDFMEKYLQ